MAALTEDLQQKIEAHFVATKTLTQEQLLVHRADAKKQGTPLLTELLQTKTINAEDLTRAIAIVSNVPYVNLLDTFINQEVLNLLPKDVAERYMAVPLGEIRPGPNQGGQVRLAVAMIDANNVQAVDFLSNKIQRPLKVYLASEDGIQHVLDQYRADLAKGVGAAIDDAAEVTAEKKEVEGTALVIKQDSPISRALNTILEYAARARASDIHIEPTETQLKIRCRIDGVLREIMQLPKSIEPALISRIKILSNLKIDEHRVPQDGQFTVHTAGKDIDLRIAISPVVWGDQVVIRLLD
ncbi:MAG: ATPase, T2SS/T4P/T4SS family, partial [Candidatus Saccharimonadales bacterium]